MLEGGDEMIKVNDVSKKFHEIQALNGVTTSIQEGIFLDCLEATEPAKVHFAYFKRCLETGQRNRLH